MLKADGEEVHPEEQQMCNMIFVQGVPLARLTELDHLIFLIVAYKSGTSHQNSILDIQYIK